jgi:hypothetical protein
LKFSTFTLKFEVEVAVSGSIDCNKSERGIYLKPEAVAVQQNTRPEHVGDDEAVAPHPARRRWSTWRPAPTIRTIPPRRCHEIGLKIMKSVISYTYDTRILIQKLLIS